MLRRALRQGGLSGNLNHFSGSDYDTGDDNSDTGDDNSDIGDYYDEDEHFETYVTPASTPNTHNTTSSGRRKVQAKYSSYTPVRRNPTPQAAQQPALAQLTQLVEGPLDFQIDDKFLELVRFLHTPPWLGPGV